MLFHQVLWHSSIGFCGRVDSRCCVSRCYGTVPLGFVAELTVVVAELSVSAVATVGSVAAKLTVGVAAWFH